MEAVKKINDKLNGGLITKMELSKKLGISRVTLDTRLSKNNWKKSELYLLKSIA